GQSAAAVRGRARRGTPRPPQARPGTGAGRATARAQPPLKYGDERLGNLGARHRLILTIPVRDPVERAGEGESGHFRIAGFDGAVLNPLADQAADAVVDL